MTSLHERLTSAGPKRILTLDGGGVRGLVSLEFLTRIEAILRERFGRDDFRLCDYFDLIAGTSTGAIIAACLAIGLSVEEVRQGYHQLACRVFGSRRWSRWMAVYDERPLAAELKQVFGERTLGDASLQTGLCLVLKRADTNSVWPLINHPDGKFYAHNKDIKLWEAVRASTAAPTLFRPQLLDVGNLEQAAFIDGAVSTANNPAWQAFLVATLQGFPFRWRTGEQNLLLASVGTGRKLWREPAQRIWKFWLVDWAREVPRMLIDDASLQVQVILQSLSNSPTAIPIDLEIGDLKDDLLSREPLLHYLRYDILLDAQYLAELKMKLRAAQVARLHDLACVANLPHLAEAGRLSADMQVRAEHFPTVFDLPLRKPTAIDGPFDASFQSA